MRAVGVEEELLLIDPATGAPVALAGLVLTEAAGRGEPGAVEAELQQQQIEVETTPAQSLTALAEQLRVARRRAGASADSAGALVVAVGTSPLPAAPTVTVKDRYLRMVEHFGLTTREQLTCGCHVHVDVDSPDEGVAVLDRIRVWLPVLLAISANSPYQQGRDTGYASFRSQAWARFPTAGPTEVFGSAAAYAERVERLVASGVVLDRGMVYYDARLSHRYPTLEVRVADVCRSVDDAVLIAALVRALVDTAASAWRAGEAPPTVPTDLVRLAAWRAGRSGLGGDLLDPYAIVPRPAADVVARLRTHVDEALTETDRDVVDQGLNRVLRHGTGADAQRAAYAEHYRLGDVALDAARATVAG